MDSDHKILESPDDNDRKYPEGVSAKDNQINDLKKCCADCRTTKTPLWRGGPAGPKSLCNACGIRHRKKRRALLGLNSREGKEKKERRNHKLGVSFNLRLGLRSDVSLDRRLLHMDRELAEEEEAAVLLMALSCGYASAYL